MAGHGRPKKNDEDKRTHQFRILLTEQEKKDFERIAEENGYWNLSQFIRDCVMEKASPDNFNMYD